MTILVGRATSIRINAHEDEKTYSFFLKRTKKRIHVVAIRMSKRFPPVFLLATRFHLCALDGYSIGLTVRSPRSLVSPSVNDRFFGFPPEIFWTRLDLLMYNS